MPAISNVSRWLHAMPDWVRVGIQDTGAHATDRLSILDDTRSGPGAYVEPECKEFNKTTYVLK
jgi:hypothetical protein